MSDRCQSCGRDMDGNVLAENERSDGCCEECTWDDGSLRSQEEVRENLIAHYLEETGNEREVVEEIVDQILNERPAWQLNTE